MRKGYLVSVVSGEGARNNGVVYTTVEEALTGARGLLKEGAESVHIVDNEGNLILPPDQVHLRLKPPTAKPGARRP